ncbi:glyoxalase/bleomycin resistance/dioxygenase family protein [Xenorhabdus innexi]|uniref:Var1 n=1 Tax=Xenorhabdus innexi TaxID=290109 RepID=A0A1N6MY64_9GAMM|nr:glyoxalase/bleomycin resistance/dioxygenase family protein [Xenorhabdus innexi]PHM38832.1 Var1 [Xenorhabdus innexi]SIP73724.1 Var1 [Xenorhabdus innexi]
MIKPATLLIPVPDVTQGLEWYKQAFPDAKSIYLEEFNFTILKIGGFILEIVQADEKVYAGKNGTVMYWLVPCLKTAIQTFQGIGAKLYRGPMIIENGLGMCQLEDPFGNLIGLRGKFSL